MKKEENILSDKYDQIEGEIDFGSDSQSMISENQDNNQNENNADKQDDLNAELDTSQPFTESSSSEEEEILGEKLDQATKKPLRKNTQLIKMYNKNTFNRENDFKWRRLNYESSFCTLDCLIAPLEDRMVQSIKNQSNKRVVFQWDKTCNEFKKEPFNQDRIGKIVSTSKIFETIQMCDKLTRQFETPYDKIFHTLLVFMRYVWYALGIGSFVFLISQILVTILFIASQFKGVSLKNNQGTVRNIEDYIWIFFSIYIFVLISNFIGLFVIDYFRKKLFFSARAFHIKKHLDQENTDYYNDYWLSFEISPCSMAIILNFDRKLIGPLLYWNYEKVSIGYETMPIEKAIVKYYGNQNTENLPNYIKDLSKNQVQKLQADDSKEPTSKDDDSSEMSDMSDLTEISEDFDENDIEKQQNIHLNRSNEKIQNDQQSVSDSDGFIETDSDSETQQQNIDEAQIYKEQEQTEIYNKEHFIENSDKIIQEIPDCDKKLK